MQGLSIVRQDIYNFGNLFGSSEIYSYGYNRGEYLKYYLVLIKCHINELVLLSVRGGFLEKSPLMQEESKTWEVVRQR